MSRLQELHPDQQAVLQLVLRRRMAYADLAGMLGLTPEGVRERALDAIDGLAPDDVEGLALEDRDRIADHLLGQDAGPEHEAAAALVAEHPPAATWAGLVAAELEPLGGPAVAVGPVAAATEVPPALDAAIAAAAAQVGSDPTAEESAAGGYDAAGATRPVHGAGAPGSAPAPTTATPPGSARRSGTSITGRSPKVLAGAGAAVVVVLLLVLWIAGAFGGGSDDGSDTQASTPAATTTAADAPTAAQRAAAAQFVAALPQQIAFRPTSSTPSAYRRVRGTARPAISQQNPAAPVLALSIQGLPAPSSSRSYFAWADKNGSDPIFLGQLTDRSGAELPFQGLDLRTRQAAVVDPTVYSRVRITLETRPQPSRPGPTIIVGTITPRS